jgi:hypothetical protein
VYACVLKLRISTETELLGLPTHWDAVDATCTVTLSRSVDDTLPDSSIKMTTDSHVTLVGVGAALGDGVALVGAEVGNAVGEVGVWVGANDGVDVGAPVGAADGADVGAVGAADGDAVGVVVGAIVGAEVGACVGAVGAVGDDVGASVAHSMHDSQAAQPSDASMSVAQKG